MTKIKQYLKCFVFGATYGAVVFVITALGFFAMSILAGCGTEQDVEVVRKEKPDIETIAWLTREKLNYDLCMKEAMCDGGLTWARADILCAENDYFLNNPCDAETYEAASCLNQYGFCGTSGFKVPANLDGVCDKYFESERLCLASF